MTNAVTMTKTQNAAQFGVYVPTSVDAARTASDIRVVGFVGAKVEVISSKSLAGAGVKLLNAVGGAGRYLLSERAFDTLRLTHSIATDF